MDILTAIDSLSLSTPVPLTNAYLNTLFPTTGYAIVTPPPNSTSTYSTYTGGARGGLAKFVLAIHKDPVRASKMKTLRFDRQWDSYSHSGLLELLFGNLNVDGVVALVLQAELRGQGVSLLLVLTPILFWVSVIDLIGLTVTCRGKSLGLHAQVASKSGDSSKEPGDGACRAWPGDG
jgi:hypothetical protein